MEKIYCNYDQFIVLVDPIGAGEPYIQYARNMGFGVIALYSLAKNILTKLHVSTEINDVEDTVNIFENKIKIILKKLSSIRKKIIGVVPCTEPAVEIACYLADVLGLPSNRPEIIKTTRNKYLMRESIAKAGFDTPNYKLCKTVEDIDSFLESNIFPVVIKTPEGAGSDNVYFCQSSDEVKAKMDIILNNENLFGMSTSYAVLESFIQGDEYIFDFFADNQGVHLINIYLYEKDISASGGFIYKSILLQDSNDVFFREAEEYLKEIIRTIGITHGSIHSEVMINSTGSPVLVEIGARIAGSGVSDLTSNITSFNTFIENINVFTKLAYRSPNLPIDFFKYGAIVLIPNNKYGVLDKIIGLEEIIQLTSYYKHKIHSEIGDTIFPTNDLQTNIASFIVINQDKLRLLKDIDFIRSIFKVCVV